LGLFSLLFPLLDLVLLFVVLTIARFLLLMKALPLSLAVNGTELSVELLNDDDDDTASSLVFLRRVGVEEELELDGDDDDDDATSSN
jgi:hypothetical protein